MNKIENENTPVSEFDTINEHLLSGAKGNPFLLKRGTFTVESIDTDEDGNPLMETTVIEGEEATLAEMSQFSDAQLECESIELEEGEMDDIMSQFGTIETSSTTVSSAESTLIHYTNSNILLTSPLEDAFTKIANRYYEADEDIKAQIIALIESAEESIDYLQ